MYGLQQLARDNAMMNQIATTVNRVVDTEILGVKKLVTEKVERQGFPLTEKQTVFYGSWLREIRNQRM